MDEASIDYFEQREAEEREAASRATTEVARQIHLKLAKEYSAKAHAKRGRRTPGIRYA